MKISALIDNPNRWHGLKDAVRYAYGRVAATLIPVGALVLVVLAIGCVSSKVLTRTHMENDCIDSIAVAWGTFGVIPDSVWVDSSIIANVWAFNDALPPPPIQGPLTPEKYGPFRWVPVEPPPSEEPYIPVTHEMVCKECGGCYPSGGSSCWTILMYCGPRGCCNLSTYSFQCRVTGKWFSVQINECDKIEWGTMR